MYKLYFWVSLANDFCQKLYFWVQLSKARTRPLPKLVSTDPPGIGGSSYKSRGQKVTVFTIIMWSEFDFYFII